MSELINNLLIKNKNGSFPCMKTFENIGQWMNRKTLKI